MDKFSQPEKYDFWIPIVARLFRHISTCWQTLCMFIPAAARGLRVREEQVKHFHLLLLAITKSRPFSNQNQQLNK